MMMEKYLKDLDRREKIRVIALATIFVLMIIGAFIPLFLEVDLNTYIAYYTAGSILGILVLLGILLYPYFRPIYFPYETQEYEYTEETAYYEELPIALLYYILIPFIILESILTIVVLVQDPLAGFIFLLTTIFLTAILYYFNRIEIISEPDYLTVGLGLFKTRLPYDEIEAIQSVTIRPFREYLGYGKRLGADGSIGYVTNCPSAIRIRTIDGREYVISTRYPGKLMGVIESRKIKYYG